MAFRLKRAALLTAMVVVGLNIWTGSPLTALWLGSRVNGSGQLTMGAVAVVAITMLALSLLLIRVLGMLEARHDRLIGRPPPRRRQQPWMRSLSGERKRDEEHRVPISALDVVLVIVVALAIGAFEVWFFFFSGSSI
jgi:hypothetical protein